MPSTAVDEVLRLVRVGGQAVLGDREPRVDRERDAQLREREQRAERDGAALHVGVHVEHADERLEIRAARVEHDAFADEREARRRDARRAGSANAGCRRRASRCRAQRRGTHRRRASRARARRGTAQPMPRGFASCSIALRYAAIVNTFGGSAVNQRATLLPKACARAVARSTLLRRAEQA